ncbi:hypothetical protein JCM10512_3092 [Bacteroides reticulotermitis JCM 10512]|uniref:Uncharacterized protein n=1 Tax=Bacteroides reticulotermitis JCM 10512 TaxID=1445607 RepID=W4UW36_9BACE|nr:hypothetical protein JCM10512_3092 [Bacteroides reticulotermitis JCM 10512]
MFAIVHVIHAFIHAFKFCLISHFRPFFKHLFSCICTEWNSSKESHSKISCHHNTTILYVSTFICFRVRTLCMKTDKRKIYFRENKILFINFICGMSIWSFDDGQCSRYWGGDSSHRPNDIIDGSVGG